MNGIMVLSNKSIFLKLKLIYLKEKIKKSSLGGAGTLFKPEFFRYKISFLIEVGEDNNGEKILKILKEKKIKFYI